VRIPPYWAKETYTGTDRAGREQTFAAWGWSFDDPAAAKQDALARAKRIFDRLTSGATPDHYQYLEHPLREEIVDTLAQDGEPVAVITRNSYGCLVLNSARVCFADVDFPRARPLGFLDALLMLFSAARREGRKQAAEAETMRAVREWADRNPERTFRLYRTAAGLRLLFTDRLYEPTSRETAGLLAELGSDVLYRRLTEKQECFRARLTPKPWRCGCRQPPHRYPWDNTEAKSECRAWQGEYEEKARGYATCRLIGAMGDDSHDEGIRAVVRVHDQYACGDPQTALA
jgi:hypothetical protein